MTPDPVTRGGRPLRIGMTGPIGCGKSTVRAGSGSGRASSSSTPIRSRGEVVEPRGAGARRRPRAVRCGPAARPTASLDRAALGRIVFADPAALRDLEAIVHPAVRPRILAAIAAAADSGAVVVVIEAIKLVEGGLAAVCDEVWLVTCDPAAQRARLIARGMSADDAAQRIAAQAGSVGRVAPAATRIIDSSGDEAATRALVEAVLAESLRARGVDRPPR